MSLRNTYANVDSLQYRMRAAVSLLGVTDYLLKDYEKKSGTKIRRASELNSGVPPTRIFDIDTIFKIAQWRGQSTNRKKLPSHSRCPVTIAVQLVKGGVGKTTSAVELAIHLQLCGLRVLLVDLDIQASATQMMGYEPDLTLPEAETYGLTPDAIVTETFASVLLPFMGRRSTDGWRQTTLTDRDVIKTPFGEDGPHLIPADTFLGDIEQAITLAKGHRELSIRNLISSAGDGVSPAFPVSKYDVLIFDCPPNVSFSSTAALAASDFVVAPVRLDAFSIKGLTRLMAEIETLDESYKLRPELVILPTHYAFQLSRISRMNDKLQSYRSMLADRPINASEEFPKSLEHYLPLSLQKPLSNQSKEYRFFAEFMLGKIIKKAAEKSKEECK